MDAAGPDAALPYHEGAGATFPTLVDADNRLGAHLGAQAVPNGLFVDARGEIVWAKVGGFSIDNLDDVAAVDRWLIDGSTPPGAVTVADTLRSEVISTHMRLANVLLRQNERDEAIEEMRRALRLEPTNFIIRKQIWRLRFPERFYPAIDFAWQEGQLAREQAEEAACGPDGCRIPAR